MAASATPSCWGELLLEQLVVLLCSIRVTTDPSKALSNNCTFFVEHSRQTGILYGKWISVRSVLVQVGRQPTFSFGIGNIRRVLVY